MTENTLFTLDLNEMQLKIVHEALEIAFGATIDPTYAIVQNYIEQCTNAIFNNQTNQWEVRP